MSNNEDHIRHSVYEQNLETAKRAWKHDRALDVLKLLEGNPLLEAVALRQEVEKLLYFFWDRDAYKNCYESQALETAPGSHVGLWRGDWIVDRVKRLAAIGHTKRVIDIGVSYGEMTIRFAGEIPELTEVTGVDMCENFLARAYQHPKITYRLEWAEDLCQEQDGYYDVAVLSGVLEHFQDEKAALREAERVVRPGGYIFGSTPWGGLGYYGSKEKTYLLHVREIDPYELCRGKHCEVDYYDQTTDRFIWFAQDAKADGEEMGEYCFWYEKPPHYEWVPVGTARK